MANKHKRSFIVVLSAPIVGALSGAALLGCNPPREEFDCADGRDDDSDGLVDCQDFDDCSFQCPSPEVCNNGFDDDLDGLSDCNDSDCATAISCQPEICDDTQDNNGNGQVDCADSDCVADPNCIPAEACGDGLDNDGDGATDCEDSDCVILPCGQESPFCGDGEGGGVASTCFDGSDNDGDGDANCDDSECTEECNGANTPEVCNNNIDDNFDGRIDCADPQCASQPNCAANGSEICSDGIDNDGVNGTDCFDVDCFNDPACGCPAFEICGNGLDDNGDALIDCDDLNCLFDPNATNVNGEPCLPGPGDCTPDECLTDFNCVFFDPCCVDPQSFECTGIPPELCVGGVDEDSDGAIDCADTDCASDVGCISACVAPPLLSSGVAVSEDTITGVDNGSSEGCAVSFGAGFKDLIFALSSTTTTTFTAVLTTSVELGMYVRTACNDSSTEIACVNNSLTDEVLAGVPINANEAVFLSVDGVDAEGAFTLTVTLQ